VAVLDVGQLQVEAGPAGVGLGAGKLPVEERRVGLVFQVVQPFGGRGGQEPSSWGSGGAGGVPSWRDVERRVIPSGARDLARVPGNAPARSLAPLGMTG
jgi:hypothetical protein